ncbi:type VII secretion system-associated protein [Streptomyces sp. NPDC060048]|uniref:type VII secretion system-associated protein n=1 Tax=unclassified Streptomyces TaxID=2593676 RepID=UPI0036772DE2
MSENPGQTPGPTSGDTAAAALPPVPEDIREAARRAPEHWLAVIDPAWDGEEAPPVWAVRGQWRSDEAGEVVEWQENPEYRPSPESLGWPEPTDALDAAVQLSATGYGPAGAVSAALAQASLAVHTTTDGLPVTAAAPDGTAVVAVYSSASYLQVAGRFAYQVLPLPELAALLPAGHELYVNPTAGVAMRIEESVLRAALDILRREPEQGPEELPQEPADRTARETAATEGETGAQPAGASAATPPEPLAPLPRVRVTSDGPPGGVRP